MCVYIYMTDFMYLCRNLKPDVCSGFRKVFMVPNYLEMFFSLIRTLPFMHLKVNQKRADSGKEIVYNWCRSY